MTVLYSDLYFLSKDDTIYRLSHSLKRDLPRECSGSQRNLLESAKCRTKVYGSLDPLLRRESQQGTSAPLDRARR